MLEGAAAIPSNEMERMKIQYWRNDAFEVAAQLVESWGKQGNEIEEFTDAIAADLRSFIRPLVNFGPL